MDFNFENKTIQEVYDLTLNGFETEFNTRFRLLPKAFVHVTCKVIAGLYITLYKMAAWIFLQIFPSTAQFGVVNILGKEINPLVEHGNQIGCGKPYEATTFQAKAEISVLADGVLNSGTQLKSSLTGKLYLVTTTKIIHLSDGASQLIDIECTESGTAGNLSEDDELKFVNPIGFLGDTATIDEVTTEAVDGESADSYRHRVVTRWKTQPQGGALSDYRIWGNEVPGVYQIYVYSDDDSAAGVILYVCADKELTGSRVADAALLKAVGESCSYNLEREPYIRGLSVDNNRFDSISVNNLVGIVNEIAIAHTASFTGVSLQHSNETITSYQLGRGELAKLGNLYINGVAV